MISVITGPVDGACSRISDQSAEKTGAKCNFNEPDADPWPSPIERLFVVNPIGFVILYRIPFYLVRETDVLDVDAFDSSTH